MCAWRGWGGLGGGGESRKRLEFSFFGCWVLLYRTVQLEPEESCETFYRVALGKRVTFPHLTPIVPTVPDRSWSY